MTALFRDMLKHPWQLILTVLSIASGVCVVVGVDIANESAMSEFRRAERVISGGATHRLTGGTRNLDEMIYRMVRVDAGIRAAAPVINVSVSLPQTGGRWTLMGIDPLSDFRLREYHLDRWDDTELETNERLSWPVYGPETLMDSRKTPIVVESAGRRQPFNWAGTLKLPGEATAQLLVTDIAWAQGFLEMQGQISYVDLRLVAEDEMRLRTLLPDDVQLIDLGIHHGARQDMSRAFRLNLTALSLLALVVSMFLVYGAVSFQVVRRRKLLGLLWALGVSPNTVFFLLLMELVTLGMIGTFGGILLGGWLADTLTMLVSDTINNLYHALGNPIPVLTPWTLFKAVVVGLVGCVLAGCLPVFRACQEMPAVLLSESTKLEGQRRLAALLLPCALGLSILATLLVLWPTESLIMPFAGLFILICALSLLGPWLLYLSDRCIGVLGSKHRLLIPKMAIGNAGRHLNRTGVAVSTLSVAVAAVLGIELMIQSFRYSVEDWLQHYLRADVYISIGSAGTSTLTEVFLEELRTLPALRYLSTGRRVAMETPTGPVTVFALDVPPEGFAGFRVMDGESANLWDRFHWEGQVLVTETLARRLDLIPGEAVELPTDRGIRSFHVAAVYRDYSSDQGLMTMDLRTWNRFFDDSRQTSASLYLTPGANVTQAIQSILDLSAVPDGLWIRSNRDLRLEIMRVFEQTFQITAVLRWLAMLVAVVGILSALMALLLERHREFAMLSAIGFNQRQVGGLLVLEAGVAGFVAGLVAIPMGILLSMILINVINVRSFGWSMNMTLDWHLVWQALVLSVTASAAAAIYPTWQFLSTDVTRRLSVR